MYQPIDRRTFLKTAGVSLALPLLESMNPILARATGSTAVPKRLVFICSTLGFYPDSWWPTGSGADYELSEYLKLLKSHRSDFTLFSGLAHEAQTGRQPHNSELSWLTSARGPGLGGFRNTISIDQVAADQVGNDTRFSSISLGTRNEQSQSYTRSGVMVPAYSSPSKLFAELFLQGKPEEVAQQKQNLKDGRSILDELMSQARQLQRKTSAADNAQLDEYFTSVRQAEQSITENEAWMDTPKPEVDADPPVDFPDTTQLIGRIRLMMDMIPLIVQTDSSRVVSLMIHDHGVVPQVEGVTQDQHNLSHHGRDESKIAELKIIETRILGCFDRLLTQLKDKREESGNLLDTTSVLIGSNLGNANSHNTDNLPILLAGGGFRHGKFISQEGEGKRPLCNLFTAILNHSGYEIESFGQSTGELSWS